MVNNTGFLTMKKIIFNPVHLIYEMLNIKY